MTVNGQWVQLLTTKPLFLLQEDPTWEPLKGGTTPLIQLSPGMGLGKLWPRDGKGGDVSEDKHTWPGIGNLGPGAHWSTW